MEKKDAFQRYKITGGVLDTKHALGKEPSRMGTALETEDGFPSEVGIIFSVLE